MNNDSALSRGSGQMHGHCILQLMGKQSTNNLFQPNFNALAVMLIALVKKRNHFFPDRFRGFRNGPGQVADQLFALPLFKTAITFSRLLIGQGTDNSPA